MYIRLLSILFITGGYKAAFSQLNKGSFMVVPSGPGLATIDKDLKYYESLKGADFAIPDSGLMIILARLFFGLKINKLSGPKFLRLFLKEEVLRNEGILFSIDPSNKESIINNKYLNDIWIPIISAGLVLDSYELDIYNRWGEKIFSTKDYLQGWDGTYLGNEVQDGIYSYKIRLKDTNFNLNQVYAGHITLIR